MTDKTTKDDCTTGSCPVSKDKQPAQKTINARDLPLLGNPYPPKDIIQEDASNSLELTVRSVRTTIQPYMAPVCAAYQKTSDIISIGAAHSQSALENLRANQSQLVNGVIISSSGILGVVLARRRGFFKKLIFGSMFFGGAMAACYPQEAKEKTELTLFIVKNKLSDLLQSQYPSTSGVKQATPETKSDATKET